MADDFELDLTIKSAAELLVYCFYQPVLWPHIIYNFSVSKKSHWDHICFEVHL